MKTQELKYVTRRRAAVLLEVAGEQEETYFTYEELRQICMLAVHQVN